MPAALMLHTTDPKQELTEKIGDLDDIDLFHNQVLVAVYKRPEKTSGGIFLTDQNREEDKYQGKVGLIIKTGPTAFVPTDGCTWPDDMGRGDWVFFRTSESWPCVVNSQRDNDCRIISDTDVKGRIQQPDQVW